MEHQTLEGRIAALHGEVQDLRSDLKQAISHLPKPGTRSVNSAKLAAEVGVSKSTLLSWVDAGLLDESCFTRKRRGKDSWQYSWERALALPQIEAIQRGDR